MAKLSENDRSTLEVVTQDVVETSPLEIADAHLHLDHLLNRVGEPDLQEYYQFGSEQQFGTSMEVLVSNYCFPKFWPKREEISRLHSKIPGFKLSFGIHPKTVQTTSPELLDEYFEYLEEILKFKNTVAVGECGLDSSNTSKDLKITRQILYLEKQLKLAVNRNLAVVIHCRGNSALHFQLLDSLVKICPLALFFWYTTCLQSNQIQI